MRIEEAQREFRTVFLGGAAGQWVTGLIWLLSAALGTWVSEGWGMIALFAGGIFIFPLTQLVLRWRGGSAALRKDNPLQPYFLHSVMAYGATFPLVFAAALYNPNWFYPAFMLITGAHYLSFILFYGMWQFGALAAVLIGGGIALAMLLPDVFSAGGWLTGVVLLVFALFVWRTVVPGLQPMRSEA